MIILSIDVGIKNLAFCLIDSSNKINILEWNVLNISTENNDNVICSQNRKNKPCNKCFTYLFNNEKYCGICSKNNENFKKYPSFDLNILENKKIKKEKLIEICNEYGISFDKKSTKDDIKILVKQFVEKNCFVKPLKTKVSDISLIDIGRNMNQILNKLFETWKYKIDIVIIENQISPLANRMKTLQGMITQYFIMKTTAEIFYISSENKLKEFSNSKTNYKDRKKLSVNTMISLFDNTDYNIDSKWKDIFQNSKKKDDLSDTFLQGLWYIKNNIYDS
mgnify:CR=1 FL=1